MWHEGMDTVLPNEPPYYLKFRKRVTVNFGKPIDVADLVNHLKRTEVSDVDARQAITDKIESHMMVNIS